MNLNYPQPLGPFNEGLVVAALRAIESDSLPGSTSEQTFKELKQIGLVRASGNGEHIRITKKGEDLLAKNRPKHAMPPTAATQPMGMPPSMAPMPPKHALPVQPAQLPPGAVLEATLANRGERYGSFTENSAIAHKIEEALKCGSPSKDLEPYQLIALQIIASKMARIVCGDPTYADNWHDIAGYATLVEKELKNHV